jgi:hypothetical protein
MELNLTAYLTEKTLRDKQQNQSVNISFGNNSCKKYKYTVRGGRETGSLYIKLVVHQVTTVPEKVNYLSDNTRCL